MCKLVYISIHISIDKTQLSCNITFRKVFNIAGCGVLWESLRIFKERCNLKKQRVLQGNLPNQGTPEVQMQKKRSLYGHTNRQTVGQRPSRADPSVHHKPARKARTKVVAGIQKIPGQKDGFVPLRHVLRWNFKLCSTNAPLLCRGPIPCSHPEETRRNEHAHGNH